MIGLVLWFASSLVLAQSPCRPCHTQIEASYSQSPMARTFGSSLGSIGDWERRNTFFHAASNRWYRAYRKDGAFYVRRWQKGYRGTEANVIDLRVDYAVGSGEHAQSYLHRAADGRLFELPVTWYAGDGGHWAMSPGFDHPTHSDFRREVSPDCLFCHSSLARQAPIDCERCHGPGAAHVAEPRPERIVNPAKLPADRGEEVCWQCHLQTTSGALPDAIRLKGSFVPGEALAGQRLIFDHAAGGGRDGKFEVNSAAYRLRQSACKGLRCTSCHDPHHAKKVDVKAVCKGCHAASAHTREDTNCVECHMPGGASDDAPHVRLTDHRIARKPGREAAKAEVYRGPVMPYWPREMEPFWVAVAQVRDGSNAAAGIAQLESLARGGDRRAEPELADAYRKTGRYREAAALFQRLGNNARYGEMLVRLNDPAAALTALAGAKGHDVDTLIAWGIAQGQSGDAAASVATMRKAVALKGESPLAWLNLAVSLEQAGEAVEAEKAYREAIRWQPDYWAAHLRLANLLEARGDRAQARYERGLAGR